MVVGPPSAQARVWSMSHSAAGMRHPGEGTSGLLASTWRCCWVVGLRRVVPVQTGSPWPVTVTRCVEVIWSLAIWRATSAMTGPYPLSSPGVSDNPASTSRSTVMSTTPLSPPCSLGSPREQVQEDVGAELIDGSSVVDVAGGPGETVDPSHRGLDLSGGEGEPVEVGGAIRIGFRGHLALLDCFLIMLLGRIGIHRDRQSAEPGSELSGGLARCLFQYLLHYPDPHLRFEMGGLVDDHHGPGHVDRTSLKCGPHSRILGQQLLSEPHLTVSGTAGQVEGSPDLR